MIETPTALIADDEPLLRDSLAELLASVWPQLRIVGQARNGQEAIALFKQQRPAVCFLDVQMPGLTGIDAAQQIGTRAHVVFVTAYDEYALEAFRHGVLDYLVKPVQRARLTETVARLQQRLQEAAPALNTDVLLQQLMSNWQRPVTQAPLRWIRASVGSMLRLIPVEDVDFLRAQDKYTVLALRSDRGHVGEAVIRTPLKDLVMQLDAQQFAQVHRSIVVNLHAIDYLIRDDNDTATIHLKGRAETLPVSRRFAHLFKQM